MQREIKYTIIALGNIIKPNYKAKHDNSYNITSTYLKMLCWIDDKNTVEGNIT